MEAIISQQIDPIGALSQAFPYPQPNKPEPQTKNLDIPWYYTFYKSRYDVVSMNQMNFGDPLVVRSKELKDNEFTNDEMWNWGA